MLFPCHVFNILTMTLELPENQHFPANDLSSVPSKADFNRLDVINAVPAVCRLFEFARI